jgi:hypothetical protein
MGTEWDSEPDSIDFKDDATGLTCAMRRGPWGSWCGYVAIPAGHPLHGKSYSDAVTVPAGYMDRPVKMDEDYGAISLFTASLNAEPDKNIWPMDLAVRCHGGLTYASDHCPMAKPDGNWWLGFDCSHSGDLSPKLSSHDGDVYRNEAYVRASLAKLCGDIAALSATLEPTA